MLTYEAEKLSMLKTTLLTQPSVYASRLQLQNVQHVLHVVNDKVVEALNYEFCFTVWNDLLCKNLCWLRIWSH